LILHALLHFIGYLAGDDRFETGLQGIGIKRNNDPAKQISPPGIRVIVDQGFEPPEGHPFAEMVGVHIEICGIDNPSRRLGIMLQLEAFGR
jgi:hypothetical protein